ncbi:type III secretion system chaperone [Vibrio sp. S4M6]|uniref:CesT family type III secretion system chaperone n=1 Tax=Vibrio sinus TaxID=2946865 RepID=UPI00202A5D86|nr:CesT family type III secretion system chaperone [Vibrio sinus]MCL9783367.1 type III secretion system chaperone [Vibrio sinus]
MYAQSNISKTIHELSSILQIDLNIELGAIKLYDELENQWVIECPNNSDVIHIYSAVSRYDPNDFQLTNKLAKVLELNSRMDVVRGCWLAVNNLTSEITLNYSLPEALSNGQILSHALNNMRVIASDLVRLIEEQ